MRFQPLRKSFGVLFTAFPDTLRAFPLLRVWQRRALLRCASDQGCWKSKRLRRMRSLRLCEGNRYIVGGPGSRTLKTCGAAPIKEPEHMPRW
jgi:hypothetical protein